MRLSSVLRLEKRQGRSTLFTFLSPFIALFLTMLVGAGMFAIQGHDPLYALYVYFVEPLTETWSLHELAIKAKGLERPQFYRGDVTPARRSRLPLRSGRAQKTFKNKYL